MLGFCPLSLKHRYVVSKQGREERAWHRTGTFAKEKEGLRAQGRRGGSVDHGHQQVGGWDANVQNQGFTKCPASLRIWMANGIQVEAMR